MQANAKWWAKLDSIAPGNLTKRAYMSISVCSSAAVWSMFISHQKTGTCSTKKQKKGGKKREGSSWFQFQHPHPLLSRRFVPAIPIDLDLLSSSTRNGVGYKSVASKQLPWQLQLFHALLPINTHRVPVLHLHCTQPPPVDHQSVQRDTDYRAAAMGYRHLCCLSTLVLLLGLASGQVLFQV